MFKKNENENKDNAKTEIEQKRDFDFTDVIFF